MTPDTAPAAAQGDETMNSTFNHEMFALVDSLLAKDGYPPQMDARHQLHLMHEGHVALVQTLRSALIAERALRRQAQDILALGIQPNGKDKDTVGQLLELLDGQHQRDVDRDTRDALDK